MRDQWRAEDKPRDDTRYRGRDKGGHRREPPSASKRRSETDIGVKIRGRAAADNDTRPSSQEERLGRYEGSRGEARKSSHRSPQNPSKGEGSSRRPREFSAERSSDQYSNRHQYRDRSRASLKRRRSRARTPHQVSTTRIADRRRIRSPVASDHTDRAPRVRSRHRERPYSHRASPRGDYYSANYEDISTLRSIRDSYVPSVRRSRSPAARESRPSRVTCRRARSPSRRQKPRETSSTRYKEESSQTSRLRRERETLSPTHDTNPRARGSSSSRHQGAARARRGSRPRSPEDSREATQKRRYSRTPPRSDKLRDRADMQPSTRPIQSILDDSSRPPSPPRPIPSFDSESHNPNVVREAYPMHGMKANDMHADSRSGRPHIDTRQSYHTSPQWTPTSSHHGSPQSGSPFSHGRGGWGGPQQFHGQPGYVCPLFIYVAELIPRSV